MARMINVYDLNRKKTAVLQNAYSITETQELNKIYSLSFAIPATDPKVQYIKPFHYVRYGEDGELYRIVNADPTENDVSTLQVNCEHVIAVLCDNVMFGSYVYGGTDVKTAEVINWILSKQAEQNWVLGQCDWDLEFEYNWEQENLLNALYAVPKEFASPYMWTFDTQSYPWRVNLVRIDPTAKPEYYIRAKLNLLGSSASQSYADICTRIYPLGYGEGVNQLTIKDVNNGVPYLQSPPEIIAQYGIKEKVLVDRQYENAESLKAYAQSVLDATQTPSMTRSFDVVDLYPITNAEIDNAKVGKICKLTEDGTITYITKTTRVLDTAGDLKIELSTKSTNVADTIADLADRVRIESVYAQGATQLYQHSKDANATPSKGMILSMYFPQEMKQINKVLLRMQLKRFRSYSQTTESGGGSTQTSSGGSASGSTSQATGSGGFSASVTSDANWAGDTSTIGGFGGYFSFTTAHSSDYATYNTSAQIGSGDSHYHQYYKLFDHYHTGSVYVAFDVSRQKFSHTHGVSLSGSQTSHTHTFNIGSHTHSLTIPAHTHNISAGIFESGSPKNCTIKIGGNVKATVNSTSYNDDITEWLIDSNGTIPRGQWIDMEIIPDDLAYVVASVFIQGFVQSRGGGNY